jgi:SAM-dependent methyltransferase
MSHATVQRLQELARSARMLAIIGASIKLRSVEGGTVDAAIRAEIEHGSSLALREASAGIEGADPAELLRIVEMALVESSDLFNNAGRPSGWSVTDTAKLEAMGRASSSAFDRILAFAETRPALARSLSGRFLDVGTGVGGIALRAAEKCPDLQVEAIDIWEPALRIAEQWVAASPHAQRIQLRDLDVAQLDTAPRFTLAWLPTMFLPRPTVQKAVERIALASRSGAWLVASLYTIPAEPFTATMSRLRTLRSGGEIMDPAELTDLLRLHGYVDVEVDSTPIATFVFGRLP